MSLLLLEPPGPDVPRDGDDDPGEPGGLGPLRLSAAAAALAFLLVGRGHLAVLGLVVAVALARPVAAASLALFVAGTTARWGTMSLAAVGGAQTVLGIGGLVGPGRAAASTWLVAAGVVLSTPRRRQPIELAVLILVAGGTAAFVVAGPAGTSGAFVRIVATVVGTAIAYGVTRLPAPRLAPLLAPVVAAAGAALAL